MQRMTGSIKGTKHHGGLTQRRERQLDLRDLARIFLLPMTQLSGNHQDDTFQILKIMCGYLCLTGIAEIVELLLANKPASALISNAKRKQEIAL